MSVPTRPPVSVNTALRSAPMLWIIGFVLAVLGLLIAAFNLFESYSAKQIDSVSVVLILAAVIMAGVWWLRISAPKPVPPTVPAAPGTQPIYGNMDPRYYNRPQPPPPPTPMYAKTPAAVELPPDPQWLANDPFFSGLDEPDNSVRAFILPKRDTDGLLECGDSYALNLPKWRYAVADGVGGSELPRPWARLIARTFVEHPEYFTDPDQFQSQIPALGEQWRQWVSETWFPTLFHHAPTEADTDFQRRLASGAQTTMIGCALVTNPQNRQEMAARVVAIGDSNFFQFRKGPLDRWQRLVAFPLEDPALFGRHPNTVLTNPQYAARSAEWVKEAQFTVQSGDLLVLGSDSIAKWLLDQMNEDGDQWEALLACRDPEDFAERINVARTGKPNQTALEDDDVTLLLIPVPTAMKQGGR